MMDIYSLLKLDADMFDYFPSQAKSVIDIKSEQTLTRSLQVLAEIERMQDSVDQSKNDPSERSVQMVIQKLKRQATMQNGDQSSWSLFELRTIAYNLATIQHNDKVFEYAVKLLERNWRNMFINGVAFYLLNSWNEIPIQKRSSVCALLKRKLNVYDGKIRRYVSLKERIDFFDINGPLRMAKVLQHRKVELEQAPSLLSYKQSSFQWSYYSDVIIHSLKNIAYSEMSQVEQVLNLHVLDRTRKLLYANLVLRAEQEATTFEQTQLSRSIARMLGDITLAATWAPFEGATEDEKAKLIRAKDLVNMWFARKIIEAFFEICVQDPARKEFWLQYVEHIKDFRIIGARIIRHRIQHDSRIGDMFQRYFHESSSFKEETAALVLCIRDKVLVEFSDVGALYVYNYSHYVVRNIQQRSSITNRDLKDTLLPKLIDSEVYGVGYEEEGRIVHSGAWAYRLGGWMEWLLKSRTINKTLLNKEPKVEEAKPKLRQSELFEPKDFALNEKPKIEVKEPKRENLDAAFVKDKPEGSGKVVIYGREGRVDKNKLYHISKCLFEDQCRIVSYERKVYLHLMKRNRFIYLTELDQKVANLGSIWIRKDFSGWLEIVHHIAKKDEVLGYLNMKGNLILYRKYRYADSQKLVKL